MAEAVTKSTIIALVDRKQIRFCKLQGEGVVEVCSTPHHLTTNAGDYEYARTSADILEVVMCIGNGVMLDKRELARLRELCATECFGFLLAFFQNRNR